MMAADWQQANTQHFPTARLAKQQSQVNSSNNGFSCKAYLCAVRALQGGFQQLRLAGAATTAGGLPMANGVF